jgi:molybdopterin synthase catalytic subunit
MIIELTNKPITAQTVIDKVRKDADGAIVTFIGTVRDNAEGKRVRYLEYEAYAEMAEKKLNEICREINRRWKINDIGIMHRVGRLEVGEAAVVIAVGSAHRLEAFQACQYAIDRIKDIVPIWKKEFYEDSSSWIGHPPRTT